MSKPTTKSRVKEKVIVISCGTLLVLMVLSAWVPNTTCSYLRQALSACPSIHLVVPSTPLEKEIARVPNQVINGNTVFFTTKSQDFRGTTQVKFDYWGDLTKERLFLQVDKNNAYTFIALITHPLLVNLSWPRIGSDLPPMSVYQRTATYASASDLQSNLPPANQLAVDSIIASQWGLQPSQYTLLDNLTSLTGINYIVTSYIPSTDDGSWKYYVATFDTQDATPDAQGNIKWAMYRPIITDASMPFRLGTVHIDYETTKAQ